MITILYCSSNREKPDFEKRIIENLLRVNGGIPIISVTQQPLDLGRNICVGDVGASGFNYFKQVLIGLREIKTKFTIMAEADCLYPSGYFDFIPERENICYRANDIYIVPDRRNYFFYKKEGSTFAQIVGTEFYKTTLETLFDGAPEWSTEEKNFPKERYRKSDVFKEFERWNPPAPLISFKTHMGMRYYTHSERTPIYELPYWGNSKKLCDYYYNGIK